MPIPPLHQEYLPKTHYSGNEREWVSRVLTYGLEAPYPEMAGLQWMMPGERLLPPGVLCQDRTGPDGKPCRYMVVGVAPEYEEYRNRQYLSTNAGAVLRSAMTSAGFDLHELYYTTIMRVPRPFTSSSYKQIWLRLGWDYFLEEFQRLKPSAVLFLGSELCKMAFGTRYTLESLRGQPQEFSSGGWTSRALACPSHFSFASNTAGLEALVKQLGYFRDLAKQTSTVVLDGLSYPDRDYRYLFDLESITQEVDRAIASGVQEISIDVETGTDTGRPDHNYVVSFQWSEGPGHARVIPLLVERPEPVVDGQPLYGGCGVDRKSKADRVPYWEGAAEQIRRLVSSVYRLIGQNLRGDLVSIRDDFGINIRPFLNGDRSWDTMLAYHLLQKDEYGLKQMVLRFTDMGAYDAPMHRWVIDNSGPGKLFPGSEEHMFFYGYRDIAYSYLLPYAGCDVDATFRVYRHLRPWLEQPENSVLHRLMHEIELPLQAALIEVEDNGIPADAERLEHLTNVYRDKYQSLVEQLQELLWPGFNPNSAAHVSWYLFSGEYKDCAKIHARLAQVAGNAPRLGITPICTTGKFPKRWNTLTPEEARTQSPCTDTDTVKAITRAHGQDPVHGRILNTLLQFREMKQFITLFLREPEYDPRLCATHPIYGKGLRGCIRDNGRISTRISTLSETGRWKHSDPNLANLPKNKEKGIEKIFGAKVPLVRSGFKAKDGWVFMEADYKSAELFTLGYMSGDEAFNVVLDTEPDVHGYNAVQVFQLECLAREVEERYPHLRAAIKTTIFGIIYGLGSTGLAEQLTPIFKREVPETEAQQIIDGLMKKYPGIKAFIEQSKKDVETKGYTETAFGRRRYFPGFATMSRAKQAAAKREGTNARIQGTVGDYLNLASITLNRMRFDTALGREIGWEYMVAIHDAILLHLPKNEIDRMARILRYCMSDTIPFPTRPDKTLQVDVQYGERWGEFVKLKH